jgi:hypothetical protein
MLHFGQFVLPSVSKGVYREISFGHPGINGRMHLPQAYRSLPRPSSLIKPSHPPTGVFAPVFASIYYSKALKLYANIVKLSGFLYLCFATYNTSVV